MRLYEKAFLVISSENAYGKEGKGDIPGGATLNFEVELVKIHRKKEEDVADGEGEADKEDDKKTESEDSEDVSDEERLKKAKELKEEGNTKFKAGELMDALEKYRQAINELDEIIEDTDEVKNFK